MLGEMTLVEFVLLIGAGSLGAGFLGSLTGLPCTTGPG